MHTWTRLDEDEAELTLGGWRSQALWAWRSAAFATTLPGSLASAPGPCTLEDGLSKG
jgi:hypothetical protein